MLERLVYRGLNHFLHCSSQIINTHIYSPSYLRSNLPSTYLCSAAFNFTFQILQLMQQCPVPNTAFCQLCALGPASSSVLFYLRSAKPTAVYGRRSDYLPILLNTIIVQVELKMTGLPWSSSHNALSPGKVHKLL